jgi:hypothetical protein
MELSIALRIQYLDNLAVVGGMACLCQGLGPIWMVSSTVISSVHSPCKLAQGGMKAHSQPENGSHILRGCCQYLNHTELQWKLPRAVTNSQSGSTLNVSLLRAIWLLGQVDRLNLMDVFLLPPFHPAMTPKRSNY